MKILILGSEGFIGRNCVEYFKKAGHTVSGADLFEQPSVEYNYFKVSRLSHEFEEIFSNVFFDIVINSAGSGNVPYSMTHPLIDFEANCLDTIQILENIRKHSPMSKYIHLSSAAVYGNPIKLPVAENQVLNPLSPYGYHKIIAEYLCSEYTKLYNLSTAIVRPFSIYGPGLKKQIFWDLYKKTLLNPNAISLHGTGKESRDYLYITDLVMALEYVILHGKMNGEIYNAASGKETTIQDAVKIYFKTLNLQPNIEFDGIVRKGDPINWCADIKNLKNLGFEATTSLEEGLTEIAKWIKEFN